MIGVPSRVHVIVGRGDPVATHLRDNRSPGWRMYFSPVPLEKDSLNLSFSSLAGECRGGGTSWFQEPECGDDTLDDDEERMDR